MVFSNDEEGLINKKLPKELLLRIFSFLDIITLCRCAQVSKFWNVLALDGSNWQRIDLFNFQTDVEGRVLENISKRCGGFLRQLSLRGCLGVGDTSLKTFAQNCRNIEHLILNGCTKITDSTCNSLSKSCPRLKHLDLTSCISVTNNSLKSLSEGCQNLEFLNLSWCDQITKDGIEALVKGCNGLKALFLRGCTQLLDEALHHIETHCPELLTLNLQSCMQISDDGIAGICRGCPQLQSLCVSGCTNLTDASLIALGLNCPRLKILEVARCSHLTDAGFSLLARNCHELEKMDLEECVLITDNTLIQLSIHCPKLQALSLSHCELITDDGILHLSSSTCGHEKLQVLELDNCLLITDITLEHLENCHNLERIELYDCQQVTRAGIKRIREIDDVCKTAVIDMKLSRLQMDIVALKETRLPDVGSVKEKNFSFFWQGKPLNETREHGVGFAVRNTLLRSIVPPIVGSERILSLQLHSSVGPVTLISAYAPTMSSTTEAKDKFYDDLAAAIKEVPEREPLFILRDFNTRVGAHHNSWPNCLGRFGIGKMNENGQRLLEFCCYYGLCVSNTFFNTKLQHRVSWRQALASA
ncbi:F-box/LRR-repeat protein 2 isoform X2 [Pogona vitticeps]